MKNAPLQSGKLTVAAYGAAKGGRPIGQGWEDSGAAELRYVNTLKYLVCGGSKKTNVNGVFGGTVKTVLVGYREITKGLATLLVYFLGQASVSGTIFKVKFFYPWCILAFKRKAKAEMNLGSCRLES